jgi:crotonobetainyl-CoA:carnitine CoA-transferase CaiB-like acyl-CoA transferase
MADIFGDPHYRARGSIVDAPDDDLGSVAMAAVVPRLAATPGRVKHAGHRVGQDTRRILGSVLDYSQTRIDALEARGAIACSR